MTEIDQKALEAARAAAFSAWLKPSDATSWSNIARETVTAYLAATTSNAAETAEPVAWQWRQARGHVWRNIEAIEDLNYRRSQPHNFVLRALYAAPQPLSTSSGEDRTPKYLAPISTDGLRTIAEGQFGVGDPELVQQIAREALATREMSK